MKRLKEKLNKNGGFTLMEMLIVIAIIAILIALAIPLVNSSLERAREVADLANIRTAYAEIMAYAVSDQEDDLKSAVADGAEITYASGVYTAVVKATQKVGGWEAANVGLKVANLVTSNAAAAGNITAATNTYTVKFTVSTQTLSVTSANS